MRTLITVLLTITVVASGLFAADDKDVSDLVKNLKGIKFEGLLHLTYQAGQTSSGSNYNGFLVKRSYLTVKKTVNSWLSARVTLDSYQDNTGDMKVRVKYAYGDIMLPSAGLITNFHTEVGLAHTTWLDFEESINRYRLQDKMFIERVGVLSSADFGLMLTGNFAGEVDKNYQSTVNKKNAGKYGSFAVGVYNGGGYNYPENNQNKVVQARITLRPMPNPLPGLQLSGQYITGKGNQGGMAESALPKWETVNGMLSYEQQYVTLTGQYVTGKGNYRGTWADSVTYSGYSVFAEGKLGAHWRVIGRYDHFDPNTDVDDNGYNIVIAGAGYDFGGGNMVLFDYDVKSYEAAGVDNDTRFQATLQLSM
jgi:hypothetical protein